MIRAATIDDIPTLTEWGGKFHAASGMAAPFNPEAAKSLLAQLIPNPSAAVLMSDGGAIGGILSPAYCAPEWVLAVEMFWWAEKDGIRLLRAFEKWAHDNDADEIRMTSLAALPRASAILGRLGYDPAEISYSKVI